MKLDGAVALVTGGGSGLGRALAHQLAARCDVVWVTDRSSERAQRVAEELTAAGGSARWASLDVSQWEAWRALRSQVGRVDLLVNNAGVADVGSLVTTDEHQWERQLQINLMGVVRGARVFVPNMVERQQGHVLNIASMAGLAQAPGMISYNTAKAGVIAFSESLRVETALDGVGVTVCCPAFFRTNLTESMANASPKLVARIERWMDTSGVTAEDVARACLRGVERNTFLVLTHRETWLYWLAKRCLPDLYRSRLIARTRTRRLSDRSSER